MPSLGLIDVVAVRNAYGTQVDSFAAFAESESLPGPALRLHPRAAAAASGARVEVLARVDGWPVLVRQGRILATTFHPELTDEPRIHELLLGLAAGDGVGVQLFSRRRFDDGAARPRRRLNF